MLVTLGRNDPDSLLVEEPVGKVQQVFLAFKMSYFFESAS